MATHICELFDAELKSVVLCFLGQLAMWCFLYFSEIGEGKENLLKSLKT
jgi:hypothetical protein